MAIVAFCCEQRRGTGMWWRRGGSNSRPSHCERDALPAELRPHVEAVILPAIHDAKKAPAVSDRRVNLAAFPAQWSYRLFDTPRRTWQCRRESLAAKATGPSINRVRASRENYRARE